MHSMSIMGNLAKLLSFVTICIALSSLIVLADAQTVPNPSIPQFTVKYIPVSYSVTTMNPYTGQNLTKQYDNSTIELSIANQQYTYSNGSEFLVYYNVRIKGHFEENWTALYPAVGLLPNSEAYQHSDYKHYYAQYIAFTAEEPQNSYSGLPQSSSSYTVIFLPSNYPTGGLVDFQVEAIIGHNSTFYAPTSFLYDPASGGVDHPAVAYVTSSGWSNTQTLSISDYSNSNPSPSSPPNSTITTQQPGSQTSVLLGFSWEQIAIILLGITVVILTFALVLSRRKSVKENATLTNASVPRELLKALSLYL